MDFADRVVTEFLEGGVNVFAAPHHVAGVVIHFEVGGIFEALEELEDAVVGDGRFDAESDAVLPGDGENFFDELGHASDFLFAFLEIGGAEEGKEEKFAAEGVAGFDGLLHDGESLAAIGPVFPDVDAIHAAGAERDNFDLVFFRGYKEFFLKGLNRECEDAVGVEFAGVDLYALKAGFFGERDAFDDAAVSEGRFHDGEFLGREGVRGKN